jgi:predicted metal-dependent hydrolase
MRGRWGSCTRPGVILLNTELARAPRYCIDYVITHELCHLKFPNHGSEFYRLLSRLMPDWRQRKKRLENVTID